MGLNGVFVAFPIADVLATAITVIMLKREFARLNRMEAALVSADG